MLDSSQDCMQSHSIDQQMTQYILLEHQYTSSIVLCWMKVPAAQAVWLVWPEDGTYIQRQHRHTRIVLCLLDRFPQHKQSGCFGLSSKHSSLHRHRHTRIGLNLLGMFLPNKRFGWIDRRMEHDVLRQRPNKRIGQCSIGTFLLHKRSGLLGPMLERNALRQHRHTRIDQCLLDRFPQHKLSGWPGRMLERNIRQWIQDTPLTVQNQCLDCMFQQHKQSGSFGLCQKHSSLHQQHHRMFDQMMLDSNLDCMQSHSSDQ